MSNLLGYAGKVLRIDLTDGRTTEEVLDEQTVRKYIGGTGLGAKYLYDEVPAGTDPLGKQNKLLIGTGALAGTSAQSLSKWVVVTRSPLTDTIIRSYGGGDFGAWLKWAGLELMIFEVALQIPSVLALPVVAEHGFHSRLDP